MMGVSGMMAGLSGLGMLVMALFWIGVIMVLIWALSNAFSPQQRRFNTDPEEILKQRYARGEISREELLQANEALRSKQ